MLSSDVVEALNVALNESDLLDIDVDRPSKIAVASFRVLTLTTEGREPADRVVRLMLHGVSRVAASLRSGRWDDQRAPVEDFALGELSAVVRSFGGLPVYGWEFVDPPEKSWASWRRRLSIDDVLASDCKGHVLEVFQEGAQPERHLDVRIWFDNLSISTRAQPDLDPMDFAAGGVRWWDAMYAGDPAAHGHGIAPAGPMLPGP